MRVVFVGAHPDDGDIRMGGLAAKCVQAGGTATLISLTSGNAGHHTMAPGDLEVRRRQEARCAGAVIGAEYIVLDHPDARLTPTIEVREELIGLVRRLDPDLLLAIRPSDYHPDHRAAAQVVIDASYLLTVPLVRPDQPPLKRMPVIACTFDTFRTPAPFRADVAVAVDDVLDLKMRMIACHESQFFEWMPANGGYEGTVPTGPEERLVWLEEYVAGYLLEPATRGRESLIRRYGLAAGGAVVHAELFEVSEYGRQPDARELDLLFPR